MKARLLPACLAGLLALAACGRPSGTPLAAAPSPICAMRTQREAILGPRAERIVLHGATLPTLREMDASGVTPEARLAELSALGATLVRLPVTNDEVIPTFVPGKVVPFVESAQKLGMTVILAWANDANTKPRDQTDGAEEWIRIALTYLGGRPGVWFDPYLNVVKTDNARKRIGAQRIVDVVRGLGADNLVFVNDAGWLADPDPEVGKPLVGTNVVYGVGAADALTARLAQSVPLLLADGGAQSTPEGWAGSIAPVGADVRNLAERWRGSRSCMP